MNNENICIDKPTPVIYTVKIEICLNAVKGIIIERTAEISSILTQGTQEIHTRIKTENAIFWESIDKAFAVPVFIF